MSDVDHIAPVESLADRIAAFMEAHPEIDNPDDAIEALIWGYEGEEESDE